MVFTKNVSEAINLVAYSIGNATAGSASSPLRLQPGDEIVITEMEHHSNIVPWQLLCERTGARLRWFSVTRDGRLDLSEADELISPRTKLVSVAHQSNVLGTINPVAEIAAPGARGRRAGAGGRRAVRAARAGRRHEARGRPGRLHQPQDVRADRHRRAVGTPRAAGAAAAVPRRRRDDRERLDGPLDVRAAAAQVRGRARCRSRRPSGWARRWTTSPRWARTGSRRTSRSCCGTRCPS